MAAQNFLSALKTRSDQVSNRSLLLGTLLFLLGLFLFVAFVPPLSDAQAQSEITSSMLRFLVQDEIGGTTAYIENSDQPWIDAPPDANLITWVPVGSNGYGESILYEDSPIRVWWYEHGKLIESTDRLHSIDEYKKLYMNDSESNIWGWGYYAFGIQSISSIRIFARVYVAASCGSLCGHGYNYLLMRGPFGKWWIIWGEHLWQA